jgi:hypothetical protein
VALVAAYRAVTAAVERLDGEELARPSRCLGWTRADLLYHLLLDGPAGAYHLRHSCG